MMLFGSKKRYRKHHDKWLETPYLPKFEKKTLHRHIIQTSQFGKGKNKQFIEKN